MENSEFLIDAGHHNQQHNVTTNLMEDEEDYSTDDHSQAAAAATTDVIKSSSQANNNLLFGDSSSSIGGVATTTAGTFLPDDNDEEEFSPHQHQHRPTTVEGDTDGAHEQQQSAEPEGIGSQRSSSTDDFEFIATPHSTTTGITSSAADHHYLLDELDKEYAEKRDVKMENLLDFDSQPIPQAPANLVETLMTAEDLESRNGNHGKATTTAEAPGTAAYLENEFTQFTGGALKEPQDFSHFSGKPVKDVYSDFMEAERGGGAGRAPEQMLDFEKPIETISSTPIIPPAPVNNPSSAVNYNVHDDDDEEDLLERFSSPPAEPVKEEKKPSMMDEPKVPLTSGFMAATTTTPAETEKEPVAAVPVVVAAKKGEEVSQKPKEVELPAKPVTVAPLPPSQKKPVSAKDELITTSAAEEMFCKFGLGECDKKICKRCSVVRRTKQISITC